MIIDDIQNAIESFAPASLAQSWDNTGVLIRAHSRHGSKTTDEDSESKGKILLTIDLTQDVIDEAVKKKIKNVLAYHPIVFQPIRKIVDDRYTRCIFHGISVYSPHTQLDPLMNKYLKDKVMKYCSIDAADEMGTDNGDEEEDQSEMVVVRGTENPDATVTVDSVVKAFKEKYKFGSIRVFCDDKSKKYKAVDVEVGVGATFRNYEGKNKLLITGEMAHHDILQCRSNGTAGVLLEHCNSERIFLKKLKKMLEKIEDLKKYEIVVSESDKSPVEVI